MPLLTVNNEMIFGIFMGVVATLMIGLFIIYGISRSVLRLFDGLLLLSLLLLALSFPLEPTNLVETHAPVNQVYLVFIFVVFITFLYSLSERTNSELLFYQPKLQTGFHTIAVASVLLIPSALFAAESLVALLLLVILTIAIFCHVVTLFTLWKTDPQQLKRLSLLLVFFTLVLTVSSTANLLVLPIPSLILLQAATLIFAFSSLYDAVKSYHALSEHFNDSGEEEIDKDLKLSEQMLELQFALKEIQEKNEQLEKLNTLDELSGIHNRRHFDKRLQAELRRCRRELVPISLIMFDIDHFKKFNDTYGHIAGDEVIRTVALTASQQLNRDADEIFRYGGEEYAIVLPNTDLEGAMFLAEKVRQAIAVTQINSNEQMLSCTISLGVCCHLSQQAIQPKDFIERADKALYQSKQNGRNQVAHYNQ